MFKKSPTKELLKILIKINEYLDKYGYAGNDRMDINFDGKFNFTVEKIK